MRATSGGGNKQEYVADEAPTAAASADCGGGRHKLRFEGRLSESLRAGRTARLAGLSHARFRFPPTEDKTDSNAESQPGKATTPRGKMASFSEDELLAEQDKPMDMEGVCQALDVLSQSCESKLAWRYDIGFAGGVASTPNPSSDPWGG